MSDAQEPAGVAAVTCTCNLGAQDGPDADCQVHGQCAGYGHPCRCGAREARL